MVFNGPSKKKKHVQNRLCMSETKSVIQGRPIWMVAYTSKNMVLPGNMPTRYCQNMIKRWYKQIVGYFKEY